MKETAEISVVTAEIPVVVENNCIETTKQTKICSQCKKEKSLEEFHKRSDRKNGYRFNCKECYSIYQKQHRFYNTENRLEMNKYSLLTYKALKREIVDALGGECVECGEKDIDMLEFDHIQDDGAEHRRQPNYSRIGMLLDFKKRGYPKDELQVLCANHNRKKEIIRRRKQTFVHLTKLKIEGNVQNFNFYWDEKTQDIVFPNQNNTGDFSIN